MTYPQVIHMAATSLALLISIGGIAWVFTLRNKYLPTKRGLDKIRREVGELSGELGDIADRFTRFQRREGMRTARAEKQTTAELTAQAAEIVAQRGSPAAGNSGQHPKAGLYKRMPK